VLNCERVDENAIMRWTYSWSSDNVDRCSWVAIRFTQASIANLPAHNADMQKPRSFTCHKAHLAAIVSISSALSRTPVYTTRPQIQGQCTVQRAYLRSSFCWYSLHLLSEGVDDDDDEGRINFSVALSPKTTRTRNKKPKQWSHVIVVSAMRRS